MQDAKIQQNTDKFIGFVMDKIQSNELNNESLLQFIEVFGRIINLETIPDHAKRTGMSYNGVKNGKRVFELFNVKFVIDNE